jgi:hypothetical protein
VSLFLIGSIGKTFRKLNIRFKFFDLITSYQTSIQELMVNVQLFMLSKGVSATFMFKYLNTAFATPMQMAMSRQQYAHPNSLLSPRNKQISTV